MEIKTGQAEIRDFLTDESHMFNVASDSVEAVYFPESEADLAAIIKEASGSQKQVTISGAGTGITGSRVPMQGGIVVSMEKFLKPRLISQSISKSERREDFEEIHFQVLAGEAVIYLDRKNLRAVIAPGITLQDLAGALPHDLFYPPDPTEQSAQFGGTLATNASGAKSFYYGTTREWINGFRILLADGDFLTVERDEVYADFDETLAFESDNGKNYNFKIPHYRMPHLKNAAGLFTKAGMDLADLFIGSEGLFGIFTEVELKLAKKPGRIISDIAFFRTGADAISFVNSLKPLKERGILSLEYFNDTSLEFIREEFPAISQYAKSAIFIELSDDDGELMVEFAKLLEFANSMEDWLAMSKLDQQDMKEFRHALPDRVNSYLKQHQSYKLGTDFVVPSEKFNEMMEHYHHIGEIFKSQHPRDGVHYVIFGHIGDCHVHFNFITESEDEASTAKKLYVEMAGTAVSYGGTISGEHGIGKKMIHVDGNDIPYLELMYGKEALLEIARVKRIFDPNLILNIGNMVPIDYL